MRVFPTLSSFVNFVEKLAVVAAPLAKEGRTTLGALLYMSAYKTFGDSNKLTPDLSASTKSARENRWGYYKQANVGDGTLLWTGKQRGQIEVAEEGEFVGVGSPDKIMLYQEIGTARIPPRPLFKIAVQDMTEDGIEVLRIVAGKMLGKGV